MNSAAAAVAATVTSTNSQENCCLSHKFRKAAADNPERIAVIHAASSRSDAGSNSTVLPPPCLRSPAVCDGNQCFTFGEVLKSVESLAFRLHNALHGAAEAEDANENANRNNPKIVGIYMPPSVEYVVSVLSVLRCGEAFLPLDPSWPRDRILSIVSSAGADVIITSESSFLRGAYDDGKLDWLGRRSGSGGGYRVFWFSMEEEEEGGRERNGEECSCSGKELAWPCEKEVERPFCYLMYTSGSTGMPKGVCGTEQGLLNRFLWMQELYPLQGDDILLFKTAISFVDHLQEFLGAMLTPCTLVIPPFNELKKNPFSVVDFLRAYSINRLTAVPSLIRTILPALQTQHDMHIQSSLKLLALSGEVFPLSLWDALSKLLPSTAIINLYGSTEVSGDCSYFDCKRLPMILETEKLTTVPIGIPISNCDVVLMGEIDTLNYGEIYVGGLCVCYGYYESEIKCFDCGKVREHFIYYSSSKECESQKYYKTGDFASRLQCGDLVFLGRKDRTLKVNGQRVALEEIENTLREHPSICDAAVISCEGVDKSLFLEAFLMLNEGEKLGDLFRSSLRRWMVGKVPSAMIPSSFVFTELFPMSSTGKVDYALLKSPAFSGVPVQDEIGNLRADSILQLIKKAFSDALMVEEVSNNDDFFAMGGNSIAAAHVSYNLGIDMRLLYKHPTPSMLNMALLDRNESCKLDARTNLGMTLNDKVVSGNIPPPTNSDISDFHDIKSKEWVSKDCQRGDDELAVASKRFRVDLDKSSFSKFVTPAEVYSWSDSIPWSSAFSRCNKVLYEEYFRRSTRQGFQLLEVSANKKASLQELWKVHMESCVDASPLIVFKDHDVYLFIGSHAHKFICVSAKSGSVHWEVKLKGRIECSAAIVGDFSQVVVGCYKGNIYFLNFSNGNICWTFQTGGEVKCQPVVDTPRQLIWCGSHDHYLYALNYKTYCCIYRLQCGGSIFGSPAINEVQDTLYVASTSGHVAALSIKALPFYTLWQHELHVPVFGSLSISSPNGNVISCLVDGNIVVFNLSGSIIWRGRTGGPVFAAACASWVLPSQVLICSRNGSIYSFETEKGDLLWQHNVGYPITASAYIDEHLQLTSDSSLLSDRLICVCTSSGSIHVLRINLKAVKSGSPRDNIVEEFAVLKLKGDIFSSPVMIGGRIFVGCRDDYVHCIAVEI